MYGLNKAIFVAQDPSSGISDDWTTLIKQKPNFQSFRE